MLSAYWVILVLVVTIFKHTSLHMPTDHGRSLFSIQNFCVKFFWGDFFIFPQHRWKFCCVYCTLDHLAFVLFYRNGEIRAVILNIYYMPNRLTFIIHNNIPPNFQGSWGRWKNDPIKMLLKNFKQRPSKLKKRLIPGSGETDCRPFDM